MFRAAAVPVSVVFAALLAPPVARAAPPATVTPSTDLHDLERVHVSAQMEPNVTIRLAQMGGLTWLPLGETIADASGQVDADVYVHLRLPGHALGGGPANCLVEACHVLLFSGSVETSQLVPISFAADAQPVPAFTVTPHADLQDGQVVHVALQAEPGVATQSAGEGAERRLTIAPAAGPPGGTPGE